jgi:hypothetical protein
MAEPLHYVTEQALRDWPWRILQEECPSDRMEALIRQTKTQVDLACLQRFEDHSRIIRGWGDGTRVFPVLRWDAPPYGRLRNLTSVLVDGEAKALSEFRVDPWAVLWLEGEFPKDKAVVISADCGYEEVPEAIKELQAALVERAVRPHLAYGKFAQESLAGRSYTLRQLAGPAPFGDPDLDQIVQEYRPGPVPLAV